MTLGCHVTFSARGRTVVVYVRRPVLGVVTAGAVVEVVFVSRRRVTRLAIRRHQRVVECHLVPVVCVVAVAAAFVAVVVVAGRRMAYQTGVRQTCVTEGYVIPTVALVAVGALARIVVDRLFAAVTTGTRGQTVVVCCGIGPRPSVVARGAVTRAVPGRSAVTVSTVALSLVACDRCAPIIGVVTGAAPADPMFRRRCVAVGAILVSAVGEANGRPSLCIVTVLARSTVMTGRKCVPVTGETIGCRIVVDGNLCPATHRVARSAAHVRVVSVLCVARLAPAVVAVVKSDLLPALNRVAPVALALIMGGGRVAPPTIGETVVI